MKRNYRVLVILFLMLALVGIFLCYAKTSRAQTNISAAEAKDHVGEIATVCDIVVSTRYSSSSRGKPTFLNLGKAYPNQVFTVVIWGNDREKFGEPEEKYRDKHICVTGKITLYRGIPEIQVTDPKQIQVKEN